MSDLIHDPLKGPTDDEFSRLMDIAAPDRMTVDNEVDEPQAVVPEPEVVEAEEPEEVVVDLPEKYQGKSAVELAQMHQELERRLGTQGQELGELRQLKSEMDAIKAQLAAPQQAKPPAPWETPAFDGLDEAVLQNPLGTLKYVEEHQPHLYDRALETWASLDPFNAGRYDTDKRIRDIEMRHQQELASVRNPVIASQAEAQLQQAYVSASQKNPLFAQLNPQDIADTLEENPELKVVLQNGDLATKERVLHNLATLASVRGAAAAPRQDPAAVAAAAKVAATVAAGSAGAERSTGGQTELAKWKQGFIASESTSIHDELARNRAAAIKAGVRRA